MRETLNELRAYWLEDTSLEREQIKAMLRQVIVEGKPGTSCLLL